MIAAIGILVASVGGFMLWASIQNLDPVTELRELFGFSVDETL